MDESRLAPDPAPAAYHCPGDPRPIDRATHLGRLAAFFPACRQCPRHDDAHGLTSLQTRQLSQTFRRQTLPARFTAEGLEAATPNDLTTDVARRFATALSSTLWHADKPTTPAVVVGADGSWTAAALVAAACQAIRCGGCRVIEAGAVTAAMLAAAAARLEADAALWIGNASGRPHAIGIKAWGPRGRAWSSPGGLDLVRRQYEAGGDRPRRQGGRSQRSDAQRPYLDGLRGLYHALRPLQFVLDTPCEPLVRSFENLAAPSRLRVPPPDRDIVPDRC